MSRNRRFGSVLPLLALFALVAGAVAPATIAGPRLTPKQSPARGDVSDTSHGLLPMSAMQQQLGNKQLPPIELNVDSTTENPQISLITYTSGGTPLKMAFGNRFTLTPAQTPFSLEAVAGGFFQLDDGTGFQAGDMIGIVIAVDAGSSGQPGNAEVVLTGTFELAEPDFVAVALPEPVIVKQGDVYIFFADLSDDAESTPLPVILPENGGVANNPRSFYSAHLAGGDPEDPTVLTNYSPASGLPLQGGQLQGNFLVRGFGDAAPANALVSGGGQPVDTSIPAPTNLTALGSAQVTLTWDAFTQPEVAEAEPNNNPGQAQVVNLGTTLNGVLKVSDPGSSLSNGELAQDFYKFTVTEAGPVTIDVVDDDGKDFDIYLYREGSSTEIASSAGDCGTHEVITVDNLAPGTYILAVVGFDNPNCAPSSNTSYQIAFIGGPRLERYNVYCGTSENFEVNASTFIGSVGGSQNSIIIQESPVGAHYRVTAVIGGEQSGPSNSATGAPCEGGPTFAQVKVKRNGNGKITLTGAQGDLTGLEIRINGVGFASAPKVKVAKGKVTQKGPLANGQTVAQACPAGGGCTLTITTAAGCSSVVAP